MPKDISIRPIGKPKVEQSTALGFQTITRQFAVEAPKVSKVGLEGTLDNIALIREVGEPDEEFTDHYLIKQDVTPTAGTHNAVLTRVYAKLRDTWYSQQSNESGDLKKISRKYIVLKNVNHILSQLGHSDPATLGYNTREWSLHPETGQPKEGELTQDNWDMLPEIIRDTEPRLVSYVDGDTIGNIPKRDAGEDDGEDPPVSSDPSRVIFPRTLTVTEIDDYTGDITFEVTGAAPWRLGDQIYEGNVGVANADPVTDYAEGTEVVVLVDPSLASSDSIDDPATFNASDLYTPGIQSLSYGETIVLAPSDIKPVAPSTPSINAQTDDAYVITSFTAADRLSNFIEDLAVYENSEEGEEEGNHKWVRDSATVDTSNAGFDVWSCSWAAPISSYWRMATKSENSQIPTIVAFDSQGFKTFKSATNRKGTGSVFTYYTVQEQIPMTSASYSKNSGSVSMDFFIQYRESGGKQAAKFAKSEKDAMFYKNTDKIMRFPSWDLVETNGVNPDGSVRPGSTTQGGATYDTQAVDVACFGQGGSNQAGQGGCPKWVKSRYANIGSAWNFYYIEKDYSDMTDAFRKSQTPCYQGNPIIRAGGNIAWDTTLWSTWITNTPSSFKVTPIHVHNTVRIWKIEVTYFS